MDQACCEIGRNTQTEFFSLLSSEVCEGDISRTAYLVLDIPDLLSVSCKVKLFHETEDTTKPRGFVVQLILIISKTEDAEYGQEHFGGR